MSYRVIQWATGNVGWRSLRAIIDHPDLELVGLWVHSPAKVGLDAGELCGLGPTGVVATDDVDAILASGADCVVYMPILPDPDMLCRFLEAGINVVTTAGFLNGRYLGDGIAERIDAAARKGNVGIFASGINPGYINNVCLVIASACSRVHSITCVEAADTTGHEAPEMWDILGYGKPPPADAGTMHPFAEALTNQFFDAMDLMADALGVELDERQRDLEYAVATRDIVLPWMTFPKGTVAGQRTDWRGLVNGRTVINLGVIWKMTEHLDPHWPMEQEGYDIRIEGEPSIHTTWSMTPVISDVSRETTNIGGALLATAMSVIHAIPIVCDGPPGLRTYLDTPLITAKNSYFAG